MKKRLITLLISTILGTNLLAQTDTLPPTIDLIESLQNFYRQQTNAQLTEFQENQKGEWLKYLPSVGVTYTVAGEPRPSASINTGIIYTARKDKQGREAKRKAIETTQQLIIEQETRKLLQLIGNYHQELRSLAIATEIQEIEEQIFQIQTTKFENLELTPLQYLPIKRTYLQKQYELAEKRKGVDLMVGEILVLGKWEMVEDL